MADNYFAQRRREREAAQGRVQLTPPNPKVPHETRKAANEADASVFDPAQSAANVRKTNADTSRTQALTPYEIRTQRATAEKAERDAAQSGGWGAVDSEFAKDFVAWRASGGYADVRKQLSQLADTHKALESGRDNITGPIVGKTPDFISSFVNEEAISSREGVEEVVQRTLRLILGAQFTENEGERLIARSYNPSLSEAENAKRVGRLITHLDAMAQAKEASATHFEQNGTLRGYKGQSFKIGDFDPTRGARIDRDGNADYSNVAPGAHKTEAVKPGAGYRQIPDPEPSQFVDRMVRQGVPYRQALERFRQQFPDRSPFPPKDYNDAINHHKKDPGYRGSYGGGTTWEKLTDAERGDNANSQSGVGSFLGHTANAGMAGIPALLAGDQGALWQATTRQEHPTASLFGDIGGAITGSLGAGRALGAAGILNNSPGKRALLGDSIYGAAFGATQNPDNPIGGAFMGTGSALAGNAVGRYTLGPAMRAAAETRPGIAAIRGMDRMRGGGGGFSPPPAPSGGQSLLLNQVGKADLNEVTGRLGEAADLGLPYSLADSAPSLRALGGSVTRMGPNARTLAEETFAPRQMGQAERALAAIDQHLAPTGDISEMTAAATQRAQNASRPFYDKAKAQPAPDVTSNPELGDILNRPTSEAALRRAYNTALDEGANPAELSIAAGMDGKPILSGNPTWQTIHQVRRAIDEEINSAIDPVTGKVKPGMGSAQGAMIKLRQDLDAQIGKLNPDFKAADAQYARYAQQGTAIGRGAAATSPRTTTETVQGVLGGMPEANLPFYRQGFASSLADTVENTQFSGNPYNRIYGTPAQQAKVGSIFPDGAQRFGRVNALEGDMSRTAHETLGGSPTASRMEADKLFAGGNMAGDAVEMGVSAAAGVPPLGIARRLGGQKLGDMWRMGVGNSAAQKADEIAPMLFDTNPAQGRALLEELAALKAERDQFVARFSRLGGAIGAPTALGLTRRGQ